MGYATINASRTVSADVPEGTRLLWVLRESLKPTPNPPTGVGQQATPLIAPAVASAVHALTKKRLRHTPFVADRVVTALRT